MANTTHLSKKVLEYWKKDFIKTFLRPSVFENVEGLCAEYKKLSNRQWKKRRELVERIGLAAIANYNYNEICRGEKKNHIYPVLLMSCKNP